MLHQNTLQWELMRRSLTTLTHDQDGQAITEFIVMMAAAVGIALILGGGLQKGAGSVWKSVFCEVSAPCPTCNPPDQVRRASIGGKCR